MVVYLNGKFVDAATATVSIFDPGFLYGDGIFETLRTYGGHLFQVEEHLERLFESARMRGWKLTWKPQAIVDALEQTLKKNAFKTEARVRIMITPGVTRPTLFIWVQPLEPLPKTMYTRGVSVITFPLERPFPRMKTTSMQPLVIARLEMARARAAEVLLINHKNYITEGTWANVFIVKKKMLITPRLGVLVGTTRILVMKLGKPLLRVKQRDITRRELMHADECFMTNSSKAIVPIVRVDGQKIGTGRVGPIAKHLMAEFRKRVEKETQPTAK